MASLKDQPAGDPPGPVCNPDHSFGGQAVIEGVMMRGTRSWGVAVRRPSGGIERVSFPLPAAKERNRLLRLPVVRGVAALYESLSLGIKALGISANIGLEEAEVADAAAVVHGAAALDAEPAAEVRSASVSAESHAADTEGPVAAPQKEPYQFGWKELAGTVAFSVALAVALFVVVPLVVVKHFESTFHNPFVFNLVEGLIRIAIFLIYIVAISFIPDLRRVFQYHGAEHKVIHAYEHCEAFDPEHAGRYKTMHPRCGTGFLLIVMVVAVFVFALVGKPSLPYLVLSRVIGIPVIVGISYEIGIKWAGRHANSLIPRIILWPGIQLQRLTTREPTVDQLEVAAAALQEVMRNDEAQEAALAGALAGA
ncbi:MAG TPA: DUF1385 domain-containing protein [Thermoleophilia bacterium]